MKEKVTVKQAINRGQLQVRLGSVLVLATFITVSLILMFQKIVQPWFVFIGIVAGLISMYFYWNIVITKWRIWAFGNVRNVHELRRKAIDSNLISEEGSWLERCEIRTYKQKQKLEQLQKKFFEEDVHRDDFSVPKETKLYFSKFEVYFGFILGPFLIAVFFYAFDFKANYILLIAPFLGGYLIYKSFKKLKGQNKPQLILNDKGIYIESMQHQYFWDEIKNECVSISKAGSYLEFLHLKVFHSELKGEDDIGEYEAKLIQTEISEFNIKPIRIENLLNVYRVRYEKNNLN